MWSPEEKIVLARAAARAPRRWLGGAWTLEIREGGAGLYERLDAGRWVGDQAGRARLVAAGAVLTHVEVAMRVLGWLPVADFAPSLTEPDRLVRVTASTRARVTDADHARYQAVFGRACRRDWAVRANLRARMAGEVLSGARGPTGVRVVALRPGQEGRLPRVGGEVRRSFQLEEHRAPARASFLVTTADEARHDLVRAGRVAQYLRLGATEYGLGCTVLTEPFASPRVRGDLVGTAGLPGFPQLLVVARDRPRRRRGTSAPADRGRSVLPGRRG